MADKYVKLSDLQKFPIRLNHYDRKHGSKHFVFGVESVLEYAEELSGIDITTGCELCRYAQHTDKLFTVINPHETVVTTVFNFCPKCGRPLEDI